MLVFIALPIVTNILNLIHICCPICYRECPADLKEGISSLIFAAPRCSEIPELLAIKDIFEKKYGRDFVSAAADLRPNCGVNRMVRPCLLIIPLLLYLSLSKVFSLELQNSVDLLSLKSSPVNLYAT